MAVITKISQSQYRACDFCSNQFLGAKPCYGCGRDVCRDCAVVPDYDPFDGDYTGDYPPYICKPCNEVLKPFAETAREIRERYELQIEKLEQEYRTACQSK